jgi:hypothetical protein
MLGQAQAMVVGPVDRWHRMQRRAGNAHDPRAGWFFSEDVLTTKCRARAGSGNNIDLPRRDLKQSELGCSASKPLPTGRHRSAREVLS